MQNSQKIFPLAFLSNGMTTVPNLLLKYYPAMGLTDSEIIIIIHVLRMINQSRDSVPLIEKLASSMSNAAENIKRDLASLIEKKLFIIEEEWDDEGNKKSEVYIIDGLYERIYEMWCWENTQKEEVITTKQPPAQISFDDIALLVRTFEKEFGRLLSPFESDKIIDWFYGQSMSTALILEALRITVLRGIFNFSYIDSILRDWRKNNLHTLQEVINFQEKNVKKTKGRKKSGESKKVADNEKATTGKKDKYKDIYYI